MPRLLALNETRAVTDSLGGTIRDSLSAFVPGATLWGLIHVAVIIVCVIMLHRTASATVKGRFLRHMAHSYVITGVYYLIYVCLPFGKAYLTQLALQPHQSAEFVRFASAELKDIDGMWPTLDSLLSLFSSLWMFTAWHLVTRLPDKQSIDREFNAVLLTVFTGLAIPFLLVAADNGAIPRRLFGLLEAATAGSAMVLLGLGVAKHLHPQIPHLRRFWRAIQVGTALCFIVWGVAQLPYPFLPRELPLSHWYFKLLLVGKFASCMATLAVASLAMKEAPGFES